jgi:acetyl esterase
MGIIISTVLIVVTIIGYILFYESYPVDFRDKIFHYMAKFSYWMQGASPSYTFKRNTTFGAFPPPSERDGILSKDIIVPHYQKDGETVKVRLYETPNQIQDTLMIFIHGGGFVFGLASPYDETSRYFCSKGISVLCVDYSLAPENPFPNAVHDCFSVLKWVKGNKSNQKIVIAGDSAGGNLTAVTCLMNRDLKLDLPIALQVLIYPSFFCDTDNTKEYLVLPRDARDFFRTSYLKNPSDVDSELVNPMKSKSGLINLPKCLLISADYDVLNNDSNLYEAKFKQDGGNLVRLKYPTVHGFVCINFLKYTAECRDAIVKEIQNSKYQGSAKVEDDFEAI